MFVTVWKNESSGDKPLEEKDRSNKWGKKQEREMFEAVIGVHLRIKERMKRNDQLLGRSIECMLVDVCASEHCLCVWHSMPYSMYVYVS